MYLQLQLMVEVVQHRLFIAPRQVAVNGYVESGLMKEI